MPRPKDHVVTLTAGDRRKLTGVVSRGTHPARMIARARILLELDEAVGPASDRRGGAERGGGSGGTGYLVAERVTRAARRGGGAMGPRQRPSPPAGPEGAAGGE